MDLITPEDLDPFATIPPDRAAAMIADAQALARRFAPCLAVDPVPPDVAAAAKAVLRDAILRWHDAGSGAVRSKTVGPFGQTVDTRQSRRPRFEDDEVALLAGLCGASGMVSVGIASGRTGRYRTSVR